MQLLFTILYLREVAGRYSKSRGRDAPIFMISYIHKWNELKQKHKTTQFSAGVGSKVLKYVDQGLFKKIPYKNAMNIELGLVLALDHSPTNLESNKLNIDGMKQTNLKENI